MKIQAIIENLVYEARKYRYTCGQVIAACVEVAYAYGFSNEESLEIRKEVFKLLEMN